MPLFVGTSGWQYDHWREGFYPADIAKLRWLEYYAARFATVELNNSFYRLPDARAFDGWAARTPADFILAVKMSRYLSHIKRLHEPRDPVSLFLERARHLGGKLGPVLLQLPPSLRCDAPALDETLACFPAGIRVAVEFRHESWFNDDTRAVMSRRRAAWCLTDRKGGSSPDVKTTEWGYVRFHQGRARPDPCYGRAALATWARRIRDLWGEDADVFAYFNNDGRCCALRDARTFAAAAEHAGLSPTRVPRPAEVHLT